MKEEWEKKVNWSSVEFEDITKVEGPLIRHIEQLWDEIHKIKEELVKIKQELPL